MEHADVKDIVTKIVVHNVGGLINEKGTMTKKFDSIYLITTNRCNLGCEYCYESERSGDMSIETGKKAIDWLIGQNEVHQKFHITFFGGEPLLVPGFIREVVDYTISNTDKVMMWSILTNGTIWNEDVEGLLKHIKKTGKRLFLQVSLDGGRESHDRFRKFLNGEGSFDKIVSNIEQYRKIIPDIIIRQTVVPENVSNLSKDFEFMYNLCGENGNVSCTSIVEGDWNDEVIKTYAEETRKIIDIYKTYNKKTSFNLLHGAMQKLMKPDLMSNRGCTAGRTLACVDTDGSIFPCHRFAAYKSRINLKIGHVDSGVDINSEAFKQVNKVFGYSEKCNKCAVVNCNVCMASNLVFGTGLNMEAPPGYCKMGESINSMVESAVYDFVGSNKIKLQYGDIMKDKENGGWYMKLKDSENSHCEDFEDLVIQALTGIIKCVKEIQFELSEIRKAKNGGCCEGKKQEANADTSC